ncbi:amino acid adenylation domain-containing protein [Streptomyces sp. NPDC055966]|uniref:non-ribosomal peptide synthetase n=1 Tax=unclassified Streptomyces TaxID=2593676 RepID=UPI0035D8215B
MLQGDFQVADTGNSWTVQQLFEESVRNAPDSIALEYEGEFLSYGELNRRANKLAHHFRHVCGVRPDDTVAILVRHPPSVIVAVLATLKAGGAYVPLDPDNPPAVTHRIVEHVGPRVMVVESSTAVGATFFSGELFVIDVMSGLLGTPDSDPEPISGPADLAYVIYTSGTTGTPKGIAVEHRSIVNTITWRNSYYGFTPDDVTLAIPRPSFDSSVEDIFCALASGAQLILPQPDRIADRQYLLDIMTRRDVSHFLITPGLYQRLLVGMEAGSVKALRSVTVAGEWFTTDLVREHYARLPDVALVNEYGPSENSVCSTVHRLAPTDSTVLIGKPIDRTDAYVLDASGNAVQPGGLGELHLAGAGLARGYVGDAALTAERFVTPSSGPFAGRRAYKSGDIVRVHEDGALEFVERRDQQVKVRGRRVELGSVAEVLARDRTVEHVALHWSGADTVTPRLVAFVVGPTAQDIERLTAAARDNLPEYMVPSAVVPLDAVPLTRHGKVDAAALAARYEESLGRPGAAPEPATHAEAVLLDIWRKIFAPLVVGLDEDFFDLGGDSLSVMDLVAEVEKRMGVQLDNSDPYLGRTIQSLARIIENLQNTETEIS